MKKIHTRIKRRLGLPTHQNWYNFFHPTLVKRKRLKTFKTEEAANAWALNHGFKPEQYYLKSVKDNKRIQFYSVRKIRSIYGSDGKWEE